MREASEGALLDEIDAALRDQATLLVLDNFEQVTAAASGLAQLLQGLPGTEAPGDQPGSAAREE